MLINQPPVELTDRFWMLGTPAYPIYLDRGATSATLFEGGIGPLVPILQSQLGELGVAPESVERLVVTHAHPDHVMAVPRLQSVLPALRVSASEAAAKTLQTEKAVGFFEKLDQSLSDTLVAKGDIPAEHRPEPLARHVIEVNEVLADGELLRCDGSSYQVLATPGHSQCSLSFFDPQRKILIISDATGYYMPDDDSWWPNYFTSYADYVGSIERLQKLDAEILCLSHNGAIRGAADVADYFQKALAATRAYHERIVALARDGKSVREIGELLGSEIHPKTPVMPLEFFQKNCGLLAKLSLAHEGLDG